MNSAKLLVHKEGRGISRQNISTWTEMPNYFYFTVRKGELT